MNCTNCQSINVAGAKFCKSCGSALPQSSEQITDNNIKVLSVGTNETQILISLAAIALLNLLSFLFYNKLQYPIEHGWSSKEYAQFGLFSNFLFVVSFLLIPLAFKNSTLKIIGIILVVLSQLFYIIKNISGLFSHNY